MSDDNLAEELNLDESMAETLAEMKEIDEDNENEHESESEGEGGEGFEAGSPRSRDEKGRFKSSDADGVEDIEINKDTDEDHETKDVPEKLDEPEEEEIELDPRLERPPTTWRTDAKLKWDKIDPTVRDEILKREEDIGRGIQHYKQQADYGASVQQTLQPYMPMITAAGSTPQQTIGSMLDTFYRLKTADPQQKSHLLMQVAQQHGADMSVFQNGIDPKQAEMQSNLQPLQNQIAQMQQQLSQRDAQAQQFEIAQAQTDINAFRNAKDETTNKAKYPHFDIVREQMADLIESKERAGQSITLDVAYENAIWQTPEIRQQLLSEQTNNSEAVRQQTVKAKTNKAKNADKINLQTKGSYDEKPAKPTGNVNDTLRDTLREINERSSN